MCFDEVEGKRGSVDSSMVGTSDSSSKGPGFESRKVRQEIFLLLGRLPVLTLNSVSVPHTPPPPPHPRSSKGCAAL